MLVSVCACVSADADGSVTQILVWCKCARVCADHSRQGETVTRVHILSRTDGGCVRTCESGCVERSGAVGELLKAPEETVEDICIIFVRGGCGLGGMGWVENVNIRNTVVVSSYQNEYGRAVFRSILPTDES